MYVDDAGDSANLAGMSRASEAADRATATGGAAAAALLRLRGVPSCELPDGRRAELEPKDALLLAYLAVEGPSSRADLAQKLWPDVDAERARGNLRQRLLRLKRQAGVDLVAGTAVAALAPGISHDLDGDADLLACIALADTAGFADWLDGARRTRRAARAERIAAASAQSEAAGELAAALEHAQALLALDELSEHAHRRVMRLHYLRGDAAAARAAFQRCADVLARELGAAPSQETRALLRQVESTAAPAAVRAPLPVTVLRPPRLVGREAERAAVATAWQDGQAVMLVGEAGLGKSRLLAEFADPATVSAAARPGDATVPFALATRLLRAVIAHVPAALAPGSGAELALLLPELADRGGPPAASVDRIARATLGVLEAARAAGLAAIALDDLHFADEASLDLLQIVLGARTERGLRWAFAQRPAEAAAAQQAFVDTLSEARTMAVVKLAPLSEAAMVALIESLDVAALDAARLAPVLVRHTGGNPLFALETIKQMLVERAPGGTANLPLPGSVGTLIARRLKQLSPRALTLARVAAVAAPDFSAALAGRILGTDALDLADAWSELEAAQVLRDAAFAHDLVYEATLAAVPAAIARELHSRVADELQAQGAAAERIAAHRVAAGDAQRSVPALREAAASALAKFQRPLAAQMLEQAAQLLEGMGQGNEAFALWSEAVQLRQAFDAGAAHDAATLRLLTLAATPAQRAEALTLRSGFLHLLGRSEEALPLLDDGLAAARLAGDEGAIARVLNMIGIVCRRIGHHDRATTALRDALAIARRIDAVDGDDLPAILNNLALAEMEADDHVAAILHFEEASRLQRDVMTRARVLNNLAISLEETGNLERALEIRLDAQRLLRGQDGADFAQLNLLISLATCARYLMRYADALAWLQQAQVMAGSSRHWRIENLHREQALLWTDLGAWQNADEAFAALAAFDAGAPRPPSVQADALVVRAIYQLARNLQATETAAQAEKLMAGVEHRRAWRRLLIVKVRTLPPERALELALEQLDYEATRGNRAAQIPFAALAAQAQLALRRVPEALRLAQRATEGMRTVRPLSFSPLEVRFTLCQALAAAGETGADDELRRLADDLQQIAATQVPEAQRGSFLQGVALHRRIRAAAARIDSGPKLRLLKG
jgi:DNA-binding SARP family transcriptional activator